AALRPVAGDAELASADGRERAEEDVDALLAAQARDAQERRRGRRVAAEPVRDRREAPPAGLRAGPGSAELGRHPLAPGADAVGAPERALDQGVPRPVAEPVRAPDAARAHADPPAWLPADRPVGEQLDRGRAHGLVVRDRDDGRNAAEGRETPRARGGPRT